MPRIFLKCIIHGIIQGFKTYHAIRADMKKNRIKRHMWADMTIETKPNRTIKYSN